MARKTRHLDLTLLLLVAPFFAACDDGGPEERHCVGPDGIYLEDGRCETGNARYATGSHWIYVPGRHYSGVGTSAGHFIGATSPGSGHAVVARGGFGATGAAHAHGAGA
jgi:hypothetical protein